MRYLLEQSRLGYLLSRFPKTRVLERHLAVRGTSSDGAELAWRRAKRLSPVVLRELLPLLHGEPEAAFFLDAAAARPAEKKTRPRAGSRGR